MYGKRRHTLSQLRLSGQAAKSAQPSPVKGEGQSYPYIKPFILRV
jgi:hypothetical protein